MNNAINAWLSMVHCSMVNKQGTLVDPVYEGYKQENNSVIIVIAVSTHYINNYFMNHTDQR